MARILMIGLSWIALSTARAGEVQGPELVAQLRKGGYILFLRHPQTNPDQADTDPLNLENTAAQRQLTDEGRAQARALGDGIAGSQDSGFLCHC